MMRCLQVLTGDWARRCFPETTLRNKPERGLRIIEEALEVGQVMEVDWDQVHLLVEYVRHRPVGKIEQEFGGLMVTAAVAAEEMDVNLRDCWEAELKRILDKIPEIRAKQIFKESQGITASAPQQTQGAVA